MVQQFVRTRIADAVNTVQDMRLGIPSEMGRIVVSQDGLTVKEMVDPSAQREQREPEARYHFTINAAQKETPFDSIMLLLWRHDYPINGKTGKPVNPSYNIVGIRPELMAAEGVSPNGVTRALSEVGLGMETSMVKNRAYHDLAVLPEDNQNAPDFNLAGRLGSIIEGLFEVGLIDNRQERIAGAINKAYESGFLELGKHERTEAIKELAAVAREPGLQK